MGRDRVSKEGREEEEDEVYGDTKSLSLDRQRDPSIWRYQIHTKKRDWRVSIIMFDELERNSHHKLVDAYMGQLFHKHKNNQVRSPNWSGQKHYLSKFVGRQLVTVSPFVASHPVDVPYPSSTHIYFT